MTIRSALAHRFLASLFAFGVAAGCALAQGGLSASYELATAQPSVNGLVYVKFSVHNWRLEPVVCDLAMTDYGGFRGRLIRPDGTIDEGPKKRPDEMVPINRVSIEPLASYSMRLLINKWFDFDAPGQYVLEIGTTQSLRTQSGIKLPPLDGGRLIIEVGPRDPVGLQRLCADLERQALASDGFSYEAAETLSRVRDPVAVPHLARLLAAFDKLAHVPADGLARIGNGAAVDVLIAHANDQSEDLRDAVRSALWWIESRTQDWAIKHKIAESRR